MTTASYIQTWVRHLYEGHADEANRFRYGLLAFDLFTLGYIVGTSFIPRTSVIEVIDVAFGFVMLGDLCARILISQKRWHALMHPVAWFDVIAIASFVAPLAGEAGGFLRILRTLRLIRSYHVLKQLRADFGYFRRNEDIIIAVTNLVVFLFVMTGLIYETQSDLNPSIQNYVDALYFTVTTLTTTGFGDITLGGTTGRLLSVIVMIFGVTLFFGLAHAVLRPAKVHFPCPACGLQRHDYDAVHCKACGNILNIPDDDFH